MIKKIAICMSNLITADLLVSAFEQRMFNAFVVKKNKNSIRQLATQMPSAILVDEKAYHAIGNEAIRNLNDSGSKIRMIVIASQATPLLLRKLILTDISGIVLETSGLETFMVCVHSVLNEREYIDPSILASSKNGFVRYDSQMEENLSKKEAEILSSVKSGLASSEIANQMQISKKTVDAHRLNIRRKLGVPTRKRRI